MTFRVWCLYIYLVHGSKTIYGRLLILFLIFFAFLKNTKPYLCINAVNCTYYVV